jgi:hypothetical protein
MKEPAHELDKDFGQLGQSPEEFEHERIKRLADWALKGLKRFAKPEAPTLAVAQQRLEITESLKPLIGEAFGELSRFLGDLKHDIEAQTALMATMNVPMESIVDSHERASASFETLRADIMGGGLNKLEQVLDTSGLTEAAGKAERRIEALIVRVEAKIDGAFKAHAADMVKILHLLERLQARELREMKKRAGT